MSQQIEVEEGLPETNTTLHNNSKVLGCARITYKTKNINMALFVKEKKCEVRSGTFVCALCEDSWYVPERIWVLKVLRLISARPTYLKDKAKPHQWFCHPTNSYRSANQATRTG